MQYLTKADERDINAASDTLIAAAARARAYIEQQEPGWEATRRGAAYAKWVDEMGAVAALLRKLPRSIGAALNGLDNA